jgi:hypothetical protein
VPLAAATRDELTATIAAEGFLKQASTYPVSFGGQRSIQRTWTATVDISRATTFCSFAVQVVAQFEIYNPRDVGAAKPAQVR